MKITKCDSSGKRVKVTFDPKKLEQKTYSEKVKKMMMSW